MIRESQVIEEKKEDIAKQIFLDKVNENFNDEESFFLLVRVVKIVQHMLEQMLKIVNLLMLLMKLE